MLDTNIVLALMRDPRGVVFRHIERVGAEAIAVSIITAAELRYGGIRKGSPKLMARINAILQSTNVLAFDRASDAEYGKIRADLEAAGSPIGPNDLLTAAHAVALGAVLVTANSNELTRVSGLNVENWLT